MNRDELHTKLGASAALSARLDRQDALIRDAAKQRLQVVQGQIERTRVKAQYDEGAAKDYLDLIDERGALWRALGRSPTS